MNEQVANRMVSSLKNIINDLETRPEKIKWIAISTKYTSSLTIAIHTADAPKRPAGIS